MNCLVIGGAGYIGSHTANELADQGHYVTVFDNLSNGSTKYLSDKINFVKGDILDLLDIVMKGQDIVFHFASLIEAGESMKHPKKYVTNNTLGTIQVLEAMNRYGVKKIIFSSTAAIFGNHNQPIDENTEKKPVNIYGLTKLMCEEALDFYDRVYGIKNVRLRYFNAAGARMDLSNGECHKNESHLIPLMNKAILGEGEFYIYGDDYNTPDGTCIRDYIHIQDLVKAHLLAAEHLVEAEKSTCFNLGTGEGTSIKEVIASHPLDHKRNFKVVSRRAGDPDKLVAQSTKAEVCLGWKPSHDIKDIVASDFHFRLQNSIEKMP